MSFDAELDTALQASRDAARLCRAVRRELNGRSVTKADASPVTIADFGSQALICRLLKQHFPADPIIAEEGAAALRADAELLSEVHRHVSHNVPDATPFDVCAWIDEGGAASFSARFWTVDPIDGTKGFLRGDHYAIAIALIVDGEPAVAALACPALEHEGEEGVTIMAEHGAGAFVVPIEDHSKRRVVRVSQTDAPSKAVICESFEAAHSAHDASAQVAERLGIESDRIRMDSQSKYVLIATGVADVYLRLPVREGYAEKIWDHAAGSLVVTEAGGRVTDAEGQPLDFTRGRSLDNNRGIIATNGHLHADVLHAVQEVLSRG